MNPDVTWGVLAQYGLLGVVAMVLGLVVRQLFGMLQLANDKIVALQNERIADLRELGKSTTTALAENANSMESLTEVIKDRREGKVA